MKAQMALIAALLSGCTTDDADLGTTTNEIIIVNSDLFALQDGVCTSGDVATCSPRRADPPSEFVLKGSNFTIEGLADPPDPDLEPPDPDLPPDPGKTALTFVVKNAAGAIVFDSRRVR